MSSGSFLVGFVSALAMVSAAFAGSYYLWRRFGRKGSKIEGYLDLIADLSIEQRQKVRDIRQTFLPEVEKIRRDLREKRMVLAGALFSESENRSRVHAAVEDILRCQSELEHAVIEHILEEKEILNARQRAEFFDIIRQQFAQGGLGVHDVKGAGNSSRWSRPPVVR
ncbi:MAG TPA: periplasmic heavy metal sensor [Syntrophobacteraceae bacterium]|nr:periplasmic heavy metal sensor [Syntrophobacteraceae bacterium]